MTIDEAILHAEEVAKEQERQAEVLADFDRRIELQCLECASEHRQLAEWLRELKERREIQDILLQFIVDGETDICCDELAEDEEEWEICNKTCNNHTKECWIRWAKMKASEVNANGDSD